MVSSKQQSQLTQAGRSTSTASKRPLPGPDGLRRSKRTKRTASYLSDTETDSDDSDSDDGFDSSGTVVMGGKTTRKGKGKDTKTTGKAGKGKSAPKAVTGSGKGKGKAKAAVFEPTLASVMAHPAPPSPVSPMSPRETATLTHLANSMEGFKAGSGPTPEAHVADINNGIRELLSTLSRVGCALDQIIGYLGVQCGSEGMEGKTAAILKHLQERQGQQRR